VKYTHAVWDELCEVHTRSMRWVVWSTHMQYEMSYVKYTHAVWDELCEVHTCSMRWVVWSTHMQYGMSCVKYTHAVWDELCEVHTRSKHTQYEMSCENVRVLNATKYMLNPKLSFSFFFTCQKISGPVSLYFRLYINVITDR